MTLSRNQQVALAVVGVFIIMVGMAYAAVPAYRKFCQVTGFDGSVRRADAAPEDVLNREITIRFDANTSADLPWKFKPQQVSQTLKIGETGIAYYIAENRSDHPIVGKATYNVQPAKAAWVFRKIECFCFTEQLLQPGEEVLMPVTYFVSPEIAEENNLDDVETITLSYTFFPDDKADMEQLLAAENATKEGL